MVLAQLLEFGLRNCDEALYVGSEVKVTVNKNIIKNKVKTEIL